MATTIISTQPQYTFGLMSNRLISGLVQANVAMARVAEAISTAAAGYTGTEGTEFEVPSTFAPPATPNLFGVVADPDNPGQKGSDYRYAMEQLDGLWKTFWASAEQYVAQLDNGTGGI